MVPNFFLASLNAGYLYLSFFQFAFCLSLSLSVISINLAQPCCKCCNFYIFFQFACYLSLSLSVISTNLAQPCFKCCNLSASVVLSVHFTRNGMCVKNNTHIYMAETSRNRMSTTGDFYRCYCHRVKLCALAARAFQSQQSGAMTRMWRWY